MTLWHRHEQIWLSGKSENPIVPTQGVEEWGVARHLEEAVLEKVGIICEATGLFQDNDFLARKWSMDAPSAIMCWLEATKLMPDDSKMTTELCRIPSAQTL